MCTLRRCGLIGYAWDVCMTEVSLCRFVLNLSRLLIVTNSVAMVVVSGGDV